MNLRTNKGRAEIVALIFAIGFILKTGSEVAEALSAWIQGLFGCGWG